MFLHMYLSLSLYTCKNIYIYIYISLSLSQLYLLFGVYTVSSGTGTLIVLHTDNHEDLSVTAMRSLAVSYVSYQQHNRYAAFRTDIITVLHGIHCGP